MRLCIKLGDGLYYCILPKRFMENPSKISISELNKGQMDFVFEKKEGYNLHFRFEVSSDDIVCDQIVLDSDDDDE